MALTDSLRILITANGAQAEREFSKVGASARRSLGQAETSAARWSRSLTSAGVAMATFGGVALVGLAKAAQAAEEENAALLRLENSIQNMPELAGASTEAFTDLAASMQDSTKFADDVVVSAEAMLGTFHLTEQQILQLTPVVADYAAKFGVDLVTASKQVGRAVAGSAGALQRNGIVLDETAYAADHFGTVLNALKENAGGFAEQEGQTLSGQLAILKNNMSDLVEGVGFGAVSAFNDLFGPVKAVSNAMQDLNPSTQQVVGRFATFGAIGLTAGGGLLFVAGQALKLKESLQAVADTAVVARTKVLALQAATVSAEVGTGSYTGSLAGLAGMYSVVAAGGIAAATAFQWVQSTALDTVGSLTGLFSVGIDWNPFDNANDGIELLNKRIGDMVARDAGSQAMRGLADSADAAGVAIDELSQEITDYLNGTFDLPEAQRDLRASFEDLFSTLMTEGHSVDDVDASLQAIVTSMGGVVSAGGDANATAELTIARLREQKRQGLITTEQFQAMRTAILNLPGVNIPFATPGADGANQKVRTLHTGLKSLPPSTPVGIQAFGNATTVLSNVKRMLGEISGKTVTSYVNVVTTGSAPVHSAVGRTFPLGGVSVVGERGPELVSIPAGGRVFSSTESRMRMRQANKGGGQRMLQPVVLTLDGEVVARHIATIDYRDGISRGDDEWG